jgi:regulator of protease activity HflC (stomatin/prohibitin superfamily)
MAAYRVFDLQLRHVTVHDYQWGLRYERGQFTGAQPAGAYWLWRKDNEIVVLDKRKQLLPVVGQEVLTRDNVGLKVSVTVDYAVVDPVAAQHGVASLIVYLHDLVQHAIRHALGARSLDELLADRGAIAADIAGAIGEPLKSVGVEAQAVKLRDLMLGKELRASYAAVLNARKQGEATLERTRGETAALRNLANAARLLKDNPELLSLRLIQAMASPEGAGRTFVLGVPGALTVPASSGSGPATGPPAESA